MSIPEGTVQRYLQKHPRRELLIGKGKQARFYGEPVGEFDREELLMLIGWLGEEKERDRKMRDTDQEMRRVLQGRPL